MEKQTNKSKDRKYLIGLLLGIVILIASIIAARDHQLSGFQLQIFRDVNNWPDSLKTPALWLTEGLGAAYPIAACILIPAILKYWRLAWRFFVTVGGAGVLTEVAKFISKEPRPAAMLHGDLHARAVENGLTSFPSAHETVATAMALTLWLILPKRWRWVSILWILIVALSRVYVGVHTPNDVVGGFAIGLISVCIVWLLPKSLAEFFRLENSKILRKKS